MIFEDSARSCSSRHSWVSVNNRLRIGGRDASYGRSAFETGDIAFRIIRLLRRPASSSETPNRDGKR